MRPRTFVWSAALPLMSVLAGSFFVAGCNEQLLNPMADHRQPRERAYRPSDFYADRLAMRRPPDGTVPRERRTMNPTFTTGIIGTNPVLAPNGERVARYANRIPMAVTPELLALGRKQYDITCGTCHGPRGDGNSIVGKQMSLRPPPSLHLYAGRAPGYIFEVATRGFGLMAAYAAELSVEERWAVVAYIRALQISQNVPVATLPPEVQRQLQQEKP